MNEVALAEYLKEIKEERQVHGKANVNFYMEKLDMSVEELVHLLLFAVVNANAKYARIRDLYTASEKERKRLNDILKGQFTSGAKMQTALVKSGKPIAKKLSRLSEMRLRIKLGSTDEELMEWLNISKTTLWRYKKELEAEFNDRKL